MKILHNLACGITCTLLCSATLPAAEPTPETAGLQKAAADFVTAYNNRDAAAIARLFMENGEMTDLSGTSLTTGRGRIILLANSCENTRQADFLVAAVSMLAARQLSGAADYRELHVFGRLAGASTAAATLEVPAPVDYVSWTPEVAEFARRDDLGTLPKLLVHTGPLTENATQGFTEAGWRTIALPYPAR